MIMNTGKFLDQMMANLASSDLKKTWGGAKLGYLLVYLDFWFCISADFIGFVRGGCDNKYYAQGAFSSDLWRSRASCGLQRQMACDS